MDEALQILKYTAGFAIIALASHRISLVFQRFQLPMITGYLITGILAGPFVLHLLQAEGVPKLNYLNEVSLGFIAFAAGSELYLKDIRSRFRSIAWNSFGQLAITFVLGATALLLLADYVPFIKAMNMSSRFALAMLAGTIFVASSPASAIAIINEMRAKGPFVQTALGVTVVKDVLVIILFSIVFAVSQTLVHNTGFDSTFALSLITELALSFLLGYLLGKLLGLVLRWGFPISLKAILVLAIGYGIYVLKHLIQHWSESHFPIEIHLEPMLICIIAGFWVTNFSKTRPIFHEVIEDTSPYVYIAFFTFTGASISLDILFEVWGVALILFAVRLISMIFAGYAGGTLGRDPKEFRSINWMPYVTQAGVGLGLAILVAEDFPGWGNKFSTIIIGVIVLNQIVGPPLFKWAIQRVKEDHMRKPTPTFDGIRDVIIFGLSAQSLSLARQIQQHNWQVKLITHKNNLAEYDTENIDVRYEKILTPEILKNLDTEQAEAIVCLMDDDFNFNICEMAYEHLGTKDLIVVMHDPANYKRFRDLGVVVVHQSTAMVNLLDHMVRSPQATQLLLGMEEDQDSMEIEVLDPTLHGVLLRDLRLPSDIILLSMHRGEQFIIPHGYTRLRLHDHITIVGSVESLDKVALLLLK
ncbi:MAG TPA: potassium transporter TrkA [Bacteroidetes bacterium]|nr:potassium transporter TrkA [Bacteroidota bacterium]